jgi:hypothetical protein
MFGRAERVDSSGEGLVSGWIERRARRGVVLGRREAISGVEVWVVEGNGELALEGWGSGSFG